jgi:hypothetical protein
VVFEEFILDEENCTAIRGGKLISCADAQQKVSQLATEHKRVLQSLSEKENFAPLSHVANCYSPSCQKMKAELGI